MYDFLILSILITFLLIDNIILYTFFGFAIVNYGLKIAYNI